jgi:hypothetical protein
MGVDNLGGIELVLCRSLANRFTAHPILEGRRAVLSLPELSAVGFCQGLFGFLDRPMVWATHGRITAAGTPERLRLVALERRIRSFSCSIDAQVTTENPSYTGAPKRTETSLETPGSCMVTP